MTQKEQKHYRMRNNLYICNANPQTKTTLISPISGSNIGTHYNFMENFVHSLYDRFTQNDLPILDYCSNFDSFHIQDYLEQAKQKYKSAFDIIEVKFKSLKKFCEYLGDNNILYEESARNMIYAMKSRGKNPTWFNMEQLLKQNQVHNDKQTSSLLIDAYIMSNIYSVLHDKIKTNTIIDIQYNATNSINNGIQYFFVDYGYKNDKSRTDIMRPDV